MLSDAGVVADTDKLLSWLQGRSRIGDGRVPAFTNADAMAYLGRADLKANGRHHGNVQSRIDFACFRCGLPPLGLCADQPFKAAWNQEGRSWAYPVNAMMAAAQQRVWSTEDFGAIRAVLATLPLRASILWGQQLSLAPGEVDDGHIRIDWSTDELILALDLYLEEYRSKSADDRHPRVHELSSLLNRLAAVLGQWVGPDFRNPNGVAMKLLNISRLDPIRTSAGKNGLKKGGKRDAEVWNEYAHRPAELKKIAQSIKAKIAGFAGTDTVAGEDDPSMCEAPEGRLLTRTHRIYERQAKLVEMCKKQAMKKHGLLACVACEFNFGTAFGEDAAHIIDCHHTKPVHTLGEDGKTHIEDLVLLCPNCHRLVHAFKPWLSIAELRRRLRRGEEGPASV